MGYGKEIEITIEEDNSVKVRDYGRGIPLGKLMDCAAKINTGAKYDSEAFKRVVGLNGVGIKAVNALSRLLRDPGLPRGRDASAIEFSQGIVKADMKTSAADRRSRTARASPSCPTGRCFGADFAFRPEFVEEMLRYYAYLNPGLTLTLNGKKFRSKDGLMDLLRGEAHGGAALSDHPSRGRGHRDRLHARQRLRRGILLLRQRPAHHAGRHAPRRVPRGVRRRASREFFQEGVRRRRRPRQHRRPRSACRCRSRSSNRRPRPSSAAPTMEPEGRNLRTYIVDTFTQGSSTTTCTRTPRPPRRSGKDPRQREASERNSPASRRSPARTRARSQAPQQEAARLPRPPRQQGQAARGEHALHHRGRLRQRLASPRAAT